MADAPLDFRFDDRVAVTYDAVRAHPPAAAQQIARTLISEMPPNTWLFEPGVGSGRMALPLATAGCNVVGLDLSPQMLAAITARGDVGPGRLDLVRGTLDALPFRSGVFDAVLCVHVLHLIDDWRGLLRGLTGLLKPGGVLLLGRDWIDPDSFAGVLRNAFRQTVVEVGTDIRPPPGARAFVKELQSLGLGSSDEGQERVAAEWQTKLSPAQLLDQIRSRDDAESWVLAEDLLARVMKRLDRLAAATWDSPAEAQPVRRRFVYSVFRR